jgi:hypothetical protein
MGVWSTHERPHLCVLASMCPSFLAMAELSHSKGQEREEVWLWSWEGCLLEHRPNKVQGQ